jgi:hypothetical protein
MTSTLQLCTTARFRFLLRIVLVLKFPPRSSQRGLFSTRAHFSPKCALDFQPKPMVQLALDRNGTHEPHKNVRAAYQTARRQHRIQHAGEEQAGRGPLCPHGSTAGGAGSAHGHAVRRTSVAERHFESDATQCCNPALGIIYKPCRSIARTMVE